MLLMKLSKIVGVLWERLLIFVYNLKVGYPITSLSFLLKYIVASFYKPTYGVFVSIAGHCWCVNYDGDEIPGTIAKSPWEPECQNVGKLNRLKDLFTTAKSVSRLRIIAILYIRLSVWLFVSLRMAA